MQLISFSENGFVHAGILHEERVYDLNALHAALPNSMLAFMEGFDRFFPILQAAVAHLPISPIPFVQQAVLMAPIPQPTSFRDGYAFRAHVETARRNRGVAMIAEFDQFPVFYFGNTSNIYGPGDVYFMPDHFEKLDYELEVAAVIGLGGKNIRAEDAHKHMAGMMILNDWSARKLQMEEMLLNLGPAKGKDLGISIGPALVTMDSLTEYEVAPQAGHRGKAWRLGMRGLLNGKLMSSGNLADMNWTFGEIIERASYGVALRPGDIIGSGTVGTGCLLELNGTNGTNEWLTENDVVRFEVDGLGSLENMVRKEPTTHSLLTLKKNYPTI